MIELVRSNDAVFLSWLVSLLAEEGIAAQVFDQHASIVEGSIGAIPRRVMVADDDAVRARQILARAEAVRRGD